MSDQLRRGRSSWLSPTASTQTTARPVERVLPELRQPRHAGLFQAVHQLDSADLDEVTRAELSSWVSEQYAGTYGGVPVGFVAVCHLGPPYVDHYMNLMLSIVDHFAATDTMPSPFGEARMLARNAAYAFIEVHSDGLLVPVRPDGTPVV